MLRNAPKNARSFAVAHKPDKYRRSCRFRPARSVMTGGDGSGFHDFFQKLPSEIFDMILEKLTMRDISVFSMVSKEMNTFVMCHINTLAWRNKMINPSFHHLTCSEQTSTVRHYRDLALLFKRCTLLLPTKERLKFIFQKLSQLSCFMLEQCAVAGCIGFYCYGVFLQTLIAGWNELECYRVFSFLCDLTNLLQKMELVVTGKPGARAYLELQLRFFCRYVLLDPWSNECDSQFWLLQILKPWPMVRQARLLFILYGPMLTQGAIGWQEVAERELPLSSLWELAGTIFMLYSSLEVKRWNVDSTLAILEELISFPQPWHLENVARLMVLSGSKFCYSYLASKAISGRINEISKLIVYIILVCEKENYPMTWAVTLVEQICKVFNRASEKFCFIQHMENMFAEVMRDFIEAAVAGNNHEDWETLQTFSILLSSSARFHAKFLFTFFK